MAASGAAVAFAFGVQIGIAIIVLLLFSWLRLTKFLRRFYAPKRFDNSIAVKPKRLPPGLFAWWSSVYATPEEDVILVAGLDSAMLVRALVFIWEVFFYVTLWCCIVILPVNLTGDEVQALLDASGPSMNPSPPPSLPPWPPSPPPFAPPSPPPNPPYLPSQYPFVYPDSPPPLMPMEPEAPDCSQGTLSIETKDYDVTGFDKTSITNIEDGSPKFWAHIVTVYIVTYIVLSILWRYNMEVTILRIMFLANSPRGGPSHTVLVTDIPGMRYGTLGWYLRGVVSHTILVFVPEEKREAFLDNVEDYFSSFVKAPANQIAALKAKTETDSDLDKEEEHLEKLRKAAEEEAKRKAEEGVEELEFGPELPANVVSQGQDGPSQKVPNAPASFAVSMLGLVGAPIKDMSGPKKDAHNFITVDDPKLNVWWQAESALEVLEADKSMDARARMKAFVKGEFEYSYGENCVAAVNPVWNQVDLEPLLEDLRVTRTNLEDYLDYCAYMIRRRRTIKKRKELKIRPKLVGKWACDKYGNTASSVKVDAIEFWSLKLENLYKEIAIEQADARTRPIPAAFVTFNNRATQVRAAGNLHHHDETTWKVRSAPTSFEIIWRNLRMRGWERALRSSAMWGAYIALVLFYIIPVTFVQGLIDVPTLATYPVVKDIVNLPVIKLILEAILPGLVLMIFLALLPTILALFVKLGGAVSLSDVDFGVVTRFFYFQVVSVFLYSLVAGSLISQLDEILQNPEEFINIIGAAIPQTATFFITYLLVAGVGKVMIQFLRIPNLVILFLLSRFASTPRARARMWTNQYTIFGNVIPHFVFSFYLGILYCTINPIICPVVMIYISLGILTQRYLQLYVFKRHYESGGAMWSDVFHQFMFTMYAYQIFMIVLLAIKKFPIVAILAPAPCFTFAFHIASTSLYSRPWKLLSVHDAAMLDEKDRAEVGQATPTVAELREIQEAYLSPVFKAHPDEITDLLREATITSRRINGENIADIEADLEEKGYVSADEADDDLVRSVVEGHPVGPSPRPVANGGAIQGPPAHVSVAMSGK